MSELTEPITQAVLAALGGGPPVVVVTVIQAPPDAQVGLGAKLLVRADGSTLGSLDDGPLEAAVREEAREAFSRHRLETFFYAPDGRRLSRQEAEGQPSYAVMVERYEAAATLLIVGGGHIGKALSEIGKLCGFTVAVVDDRPDYANRERFPQADQVLCGDFVETLRRFPVDQNTYVVLVTRGHRHDERSLRQVVSSKAAYIGMIGSKRRVATVLQHLIDDGVPEEAVAHVHAPIGLDIGAETPEEIAVAIMAEIIQERRAQAGARGGGGSGRPMRQVKPARPGRAKRGVSSPERVAGLE